MSALWEGQDGGTVSLRASLALQHLAFHALEIKSDLEFRISLLVFVIKVTIKHEVLVSETVGGHSQADSFSRVYFQFLFFPSLASALN